MLTSARQHVTEVAEVVSSRPISVALMRFALSVVRLILNALRNRHLLLRSSVSDNSQKRS